MIFGRYVTEKVRNQTMLSLFSHLTYLVLQHYFVKEETQKTTAGTMLPQQPRAERIDYKI